MRRIVVFLTALSALVACGADGPPVRPSLSTTVSAGSHGVSGSVRTGVRIGGVNIGVGTGL